VLLSKKNTQRSYLKIMLLKVLSVHIGSWLKLSDGLLLWSLWYF